MALNLNYKMIVSATLYQVSWLVLIFGSALWVPFVLLGFLLAHYVFVARSFSGWQAVALLAIFGFLIDCFLAFVKVYQFDSPLLTWLAVLWVVFSVSLPFGFGFILKNRVFASVLMGLFAPVSYWVAIGARPDVSFGAWGEYALIVVGVYWAIFIQIAITLYRRFPAQAQNSSNFFKNFANPSRNSLKSSKV
jgi:hypothetical protein